MAKPTKTRSGGTAKKAATARKDVASRKPRASTTSATVTEQQLRFSLKPLPKTQPSVSLSPKEIEKELELAHKIHSQAGFLLVAMLATRRLNLQRVRNAALMTQDAADNLKRLVELLEKT